MVIQDNVKFEFHQPTDVNAGGLAGRQRIPTTPMSTKYTKIRGHLSTLTTSDRGMPISEASRTATHSIVAMFGPEMDDVHEGLTVNITHRKNPRTKGYQPVTNSADNQREFTSFLVKELQVLDHASGYRRLMLVAVGKGKAAING